jgi:hyaluronoglucosaminidase
MTSIRKQLFRVLILAGMFPFGLQARTFAVTHLKVDVSPAPQHVLNVAGTAEMPVSYKMVLPQKGCAQAVALLKELMPRGVSKSSFSVVLGKRGDKTVARFASLIPQKAEGYYLKVAENGIVVAGNDERGTYYGVQSLRQLLKNGMLHVATLQDWPDVSRRGVVEGFYGTPWSHEARLRQLAFYGRNKLNTYIYGPKDDPYHSTPHWRLSYPEKEAGQIKQLVDTARKYCVDFVWAIHPGRDIRWNEADRDSLLHKFESMYSLGVRAFAVFFDDISGDGTDPNRQAELLNYLDDHFVKMHADVEPLIMCPTEYNKAWSNVEDGYLTTLGHRLNRSVQIMWTGDYVISCIDMAALKWINPLLQRKAYIWWNFPVNDYVRDHLLVGPVYGNGLDIKDSVAAFVANPMERAEASKVALYSVADYTWHMSAFDSDASWRNSLADLLPLNFWALHVFASHCSDLGPNGHGFRRDESVDLQPALARLLKTSGEDVKARDSVALACRDLAMAADILLADKENIFLIDEMRPWLQQAKLVGEYGQDVMHMQGYTLETDGGNSSDFLQYYSHAKAMQTLMYEADAQYNQNPYQPGVKVASKVLLPTLNKLYTSAVQMFNHLEGTILDTMAVYQPYQWQSNIEQLARQPLQWKGRQVQVSPLNEVVQWPGEGYAGITFDKVKILTRATFDLGTKNIASAFLCEVSTDGHTWQPLGLSQKENQTVIDAQIPAETKISAIRLRNVSNKSQQVYLKRMMVVCQ